jgi:hypothetical protein
MNQRTADQQPHEPTPLDQRVKLLKGWASLHPLDTAPPIDLPGPVFRRSGERYEPLVPWRFRG